MTPRFEVLQQGMVMIETNEVANAYSLTKLSGGFGMRKIGSQYLGSCFYGVSDCSSGAKAGVYGLPQRKKDPAR